MMVMEVLDMAQIRHCRGDRGVKIRSAVTGDLQVMTFGQRSRPNQTVQPPHRVTSACKRSTPPLFEHAGEVAEGVAVLPSGHITIEPVPDEGQPTRSWEDTGSSNQVTAKSLARLWPRRTVCLDV